MEIVEKESKETKDATKKLDKKHKKWKPKWKEMDKDIDYLKNNLKEKTDRVIFYEEIEKLKNLIIQLGSKEIPAPIIQNVMDP